MSLLTLGYNSLRLLLIVALTAKSVLSQNSRATFGNSPAPFKIDVDPAFIQETVLKASLTRYAIDIEGPAMQDGPSRENTTTVRDYWVNHYDWFRIQDRLNKQYLFLASLGCQPHAPGSFNLFILIVFIDLNNLQPQ